MTGPRVRDMSWQNLFAKCQADPIWSANKLINQDKRIQELEAAALNDLAQIQDILDGKQ